MEDIQSVSGLGPVFGLGVLGGLAIEVMRWWQLRTRERLPLYAKRPVYWLSTIAMILIGGILATLYGVAERNPIAVVQLGASAPALLGAMASGQKQFPDTSLDASGELKDGSSELAGAKKGRDVRISIKRKINVSDYLAFLSFRG